MFFSCSSQSQPDLPLKRRRARRLSISSESGSDDDGKKRKSGKSNLKRKAVERPAHPPASKRKKSTSSTPAADPARAFCLGKLEGVFHEIFLRYPHVAGVEKKLEELSEGEKAKVEEEAKQFATDLEQCVYDIYSETDQTGKTSAGSNYKYVSFFFLPPQTLISLRRDRFRMLQFNLREKDRVSLHRGIASGDITPKELSLMSPADLANEQLKESIRIAEEEALAHSILEKTAVPRAKLTHKGLEELETTVDTDEAAQREREQARRKEEEEKRAREQAARLRARTASVSAPPESPTTGAAWGGKPPPVHVPPTPSDETGMGASASFGGPAMEMSGMTPLEPEMNLADLINIDDELAVVTGDVAAPAAETKAASPPVAESPVTGISPFATKSEAPRASFDLNSLWAASKEEEEEELVASPPQPQRGSPVPMEGKEEEMDLDTDDMDFDVFLDEKNDAVPTPEALQATFNAIPQVWTGKVRAFLVVTSNLVNKTL